MDLIFLLLLLTGGLLGYIMHLFFGRRALKMRMIKAGWADETIPRMGEIHKGYDSIDLEPAVDLIPRPSGSGDDLSIMVKMALLACIIGIIYVFLFTNHQKSAQLACEPTFCRYTPETSHFIFLGAAILVLEFVIVTTGRLIYSSLTFIGTVWTMGILSLAFGLLLKFSC